MFRQSNTAYSFKQFKNVSRFYFKKISVYIYCIVLVCGQRPQNIIYESVGWTRSQNCALFSFIPHWLAGRSWTAFFVNIFCACTFVTGWSRIHNIQQILYMKERFEWHSNVLITESQFIGIFILIMVHNGRLISEPI